MKKMKQTTDNRRWWSVVGGGALVLAGLAVGTAVTPVTGWDAAPRMVTALASSVDSPAPITGTQGTAKFTIEDQVLYITAGTLKKDAGWQWLTHKKDFDRVNFAEGVQVVGDASGMFQGIQELDGNFEALDVSGVTNMAYMFADTESGEVDVSGWDTRKVTNLDHTFDAEELEVKGLKEWQVGQVTTMNGTFSKVMPDDDLEVANWDTHNVTSMIGTFEDARMITILDIRGWDMRQVKDCSNFMAMNRPLNMRGERFMCVIVFGPNVRFTAAKGTPAFPKSWGWNREWQEISLKDGMVSEEAFMRDPVTQADRIQAMYTGDQVPQETRAFVPRRAWVKLMGHMEKVVDGQPAELDASKYQVKLPGGITYQLKPADIDFEEEYAEDVTEPGTYQVSFSETGLRHIRDAVQDFEDLHNIDGTLVPYIHPYFFGTYTIKTADDAETPTSPATGEPVTVTYQSLQGEVLATEKLTGNLDQSWGTSSREFDGYTLDHVEGDIAGSFTAEPQQVTYYYSPLDEADEVPEVPGGNENPEEPGKPEEPGTGNPAPGDQTPGDGSGDQNTGKPEPTPEPTPDPGQPGGTLPPVKPQIPLLPPAGGDHTAAPEEPGRPGSTPQPGTPGTAQPDQSTKPEPTTPSVPKPKPSVPDKPERPQQPQKPQSATEVPVSHQNSHPTSTHRPVTQPSVQQPVTSTSAMVGHPSPFPINSVQPTALHDPQKPSQVVTGTALPQTGEQAAPQLVIWGTTLLASLSGWLWWRQRRSTKK